jgi:hypothetical protein
MESSKSPRPKKGETGKEQSQEHAHNFFDIKGIAYKEFILAGQTVNSAYYCDVLWLLCENVRRLHPELWLQKNCLLHQDNTHRLTLPFFTSKFLTGNNMAVVSHPPNFSLFSQLKMKLKGSHFDIIEAIEAELQTLLNVLTEHDFEDVFKKWQKGWEWCIHAEGD